MTSRPKHDLAVITDMSDAKARGRTPHCWGVMDTATDNWDVICEVPLTGDSDYDKNVLEPTLPTAMPPSRLARSRQMPRSVVIGVRSLKLRQPDCRSGQRRGRWKPNRNGSR